MIRRFFVPGNQMANHMPAGVAVGSAVDGAATAQNAKNPDVVAEGYLKNDLEKKLVLIAPSSTPIDTVTREVGNTRKTKSIETGGWEISVRDIDDEVNEAVVASDEGITGQIKIEKPALWQPGDTFMVDEATNGKLFYYVDSKSGSVLSVTRIGYKSSDAHKFPSIAADSKITRMSKAMPELAAQTKPVYQTPSSRTNYCQIHMAQVEESVVHALHEKEVAYDYATIKEQTIYDLKWRMEMSNLWGKKDYFANAAGDMIYTSDGLWNQIENQHILTPAQFKTYDWINLTKQIFDGNNGSERRILICGSELMAYFANVPDIQKQLEAKNVEVVLGVKFNRVITNFGELLIKCANNTFINANAFKGLVLDPSYIRRDVYEQLSTTPLDLDSTGQRRVKAERMLENYCLYIENQPVHSKIVAEPEAPVPVGAHLETPVLSVSGLSATGVTVSWGAVRNAAKYQVSSDGGATWSDVTGATSKAFTGLTASTLYDIKVVAVPASSSAYLESEAAEIKVTTPAAV